MLEKLRAGGRVPDVGCGLGESTPRVLFDTRHDMGGPVGAARRIRQALAPDGTLMRVEPAAGDALEQARL